MPTKGSYTINEQHVWEEPTDEPDAPEIRIDAPLPEIQIFQLNDDGSRESIQDLYFDPDYYDKNYIEEDGQILRIAGNGETFEPFRQFSDDF